MRIQKPDAALEADIARQAHQKARKPTSGRVLARLVEERAAEELSYPKVRNYVRVRRAHVDVEAGLRVEVFVPQ